jgi:hypothetical protein
MTVGRLPAFSDIAGFSCRDATIVMAPAEVIDRYDGRTATFIGNRSSVRAP